MRYPGISPDFRFANIIGGLTPLLGSWLLQQSGGKSWIIALFLLVGRAVTTGCVWSMRLAAGLRLDLDPAEQRARQNDRHSQIRCIHNPKERKASNEKGRTLQGHHVSRPYDLHQG